MFERDIFSITGLPPEVLAVAMAKYSRSQESIKETIDELTEEKSAEFHEKWVLGYGDASVADMAVIPFALENVSILASKVVEDNRIASYQEKSTRYVPFNTERFHTPEEILAEPRALAIYQEGIQELMNGYAKTIETMTAYYGTMYPRPDTIKEKPYANKLRARSLDVARYLLPTATLTNFGMIINARSLRHCISKLLAHPLREMQQVGKELEYAATHPAYNPNVKKFDEVLNSLLGSTTEPHLVEQLKNQLSLQVKGAPTLVKYTEPKQYLLKKRETMRRWTESLQLTAGNSEDGKEPRVDYVDESISPEDELVASLLYPESTASFRSILEIVKKISTEKKQEIITSVQKERTSHDWVSREFEVGQGLIFDTYFDYGAFRDLQRHRLCTQLNQELGVEHGYEIPRDLKEAGGLEHFESLLRSNHGRVKELQGLVGQSAQYAIAMGWRKRTLFKMNLRELHHFIELRTKAGGHFSYRDLCYSMYEKVKTAHPLLVSDLRAVKPNFPQEFFER